MVVPGTAILRTAAYAEDSDQRKASHNQDHHSSGEDREQAGSTNTREILGRADEGSEIKAKSSLEISDPDGP
jgi:hypothetical protein